MTLGSTIHEIIQLARAGSPPIPRAFDKIITVGASMGSLALNYLNVNYPQDADATILTGFAKDWATVIPGSNQDFKTSTDTDVSQDLPTPQGYFQLPA